MTHRQMATGGYACRSGLGGSPATGIRFPPELEWLPRREVLVVTCCLGVQVFEVVHGQTAAAAAREQEQMACSHAENRKSCRSGF